MIGFPTRILAVLCLLAVYVSAGVDQCKPIGWATRSGRTSAAFEVTGGGNATPITVTTFSDLQKYAKDSSPRVIYVDGTLGSGWSGTTGDRLNITASNKTIIGLRPGTLLKAPIHITSKASNIIIRNIVIRGPGSNADQAWDNLTIEGESKNIWIDHCEFWDGQDGNADVVKGSDNVTFTWCIFGYEKKSTHNLSNLIGSSDDETISEGKLNVTYMFNWWKAANQRKPRCRYGNVHVVNNLLTGDASVTSGTDVLGVSAGHMCTVRTERNVFINEANPIYTGNANGTGVNETIDNIFTNCSGNTKGTGTSFTPPYDYTDFMLSASEVEAVVKSNAGATLASPTACGESTPASSSSVTSVSSSSVERNVEKAYQAEKGMINGGVVESSNVGFWGDGYVNFDKGGDFEFPMMVNVAGEYRFEIDFANGSSEDRSLVISVGASDTTVVFEKTGAWTIWSTKEISLKLSAGENSIRFATVDGNDGPNIDQFDAFLVKKTEVKPEEKPEEKLEEKTEDKSAEKPDAFLPHENQDYVTRNGLCRVTLFNTKGVKMRYLEVENEKIGDAAWITRGLPSGIYMLRIRIADRTLQRFITVK